MSDPRTGGVRVVVAAAVVDRLDRPTTLLAARRSAPKSLAGRWEFPGGKVEPGETHHEALAREMREELGVEVELGGYVAGPADGAWPVLGGYLMHVWLARITQGVPEPLVDHDELRWLDHGRWLDVPWLDADVPIVHAVTRLDVTGNPAG
jgi:8-oxo-dGTP diphosphatase